MTKRSITCLALFILVLTNLSQAQNDPTPKEKDFEVWTSASIIYKYNKRLRFELNEQLRLKENGTAIDQYFTQLGARYAWKSGLSLALATRFIRENDNKGKVQGYENHFRWQTDLGYTHKIDRLKLRYRLRFQNKREIGIPVAADKFRLKVGGDYNIKKSKLEPNLSAELFYASNDQALTKLRMTAGIEYKIKKRARVGAFYRAEESLIADEPSIVYIAGLKYEYRIKRKK